jgi:hypothetical protein
MRSFVVLMIFAIVVGAGCSKKVADEKVAEEVAKTMCAKLKECGPPAVMADTTCETGLTASYKTALGFTGHAGKVTESALNSCLSEIKAFKCESFAEFKPPTSCRFLKGQ